MAQRINKQTIVRTRQVISALQEEGELSMTQISLILRYSASGTRKHISRLRQAGIIDSRMVYTKSSGNVMIRLIADGAKVADFLKQIDSGISITAVVHRKKKAATFAVGTMVHEMLDDMGMRIRKNANVVIQRDPLTAALFGPAKSGVSNV